MRRRQRGGLSFFTVGLIALAFAVVVTYFGFTKAIPFRDHYEVKARFETTNNIRPKSPVRIAGVNVGEVVDVEFDGGENEESGVVTMRINDKGRPIRRDATFMIRPRIFLEGNFFIDAQPGSPSAPELEDGDVVPVQQTSTPVQFDQILTALQRDTREDLKVLLAELGTGLEGGAEGYNRSIPFWEPAYRDSAIVAEALLGRNPGDLSGFIRNFGRVAAALDRNPEQLKNFISDFNATAGAFARERDNLEAAIAELPRTLAAAQPALGDLNDAFPPLRRLIADARPAVRSSGPTLAANQPLIEQLRGLISRSELRGLVADLRPTIPNLARLTQRTVPLLREVRRASSCQNEVILPWTQDTIQDPNFPATGPVFQESVKWLPGITGESRSFDANGESFHISLKPPNFIFRAPGGRVFPVGREPQGVNPPPMNQPQIRYDVDCETQEQPDLRTRVGDPPPTERINETPATRLRERQQATRAARYLNRLARQQGLDDELRFAEPGEAGGRGGAGQGEGATGEVGE